MADRALRPQMLPPERPRLRELNEQQLRESIELHRQWLESDERVGHRADLSRANLEGAELGGAVLRRANLRKASLRGADLSTADLREASLIRADLRGSCLLGARLQDADLQGAVVTDAMGLLAEQMAGANLSGAELPRDLLEQPGLERAARAARGARRVFLGMLLACGAALLVVATTSDVQLLVGSTAPAGSGVPMAGFYQVAPLLLLGLYVAFHFRLERLWARLAELPAIFPDGRPLDEKVDDWLLMRLVRPHLAWLRHQRPPLAPLEKFAVNLLTYWTLPITLLFFWGRYLTRQDLRDSILHVALVVIALLLALYFKGRVGRNLGRQDNRARYFDYAQTDERRLRPSTVALSTGCLLALLSLGAIYGLPYAHNRAPEIDPFDPRRWAAHFLWALGYDPFADLTRSELSRRPPGWSGGDESLDQVLGAQLNRASLRYADGYRAFLARADLWEADLQGANFSEADLRDANLRQANLRFAVLDRSRLAGSKLQQADLNRANLSRADLRRADLSYADLTAALLVDARLEAASLYEARLPAASLTQAKLNKADLRGATLSDAKLGFAELRGAILWSARLQRARLENASLHGALLIEADLREAVLRGAVLEGAVLHGANLSGADITGADFRGAVALTAEQVCSTARRRRVLLDPPLDADVEQRCGRSD